VFAAFVNEARNAEERKMQRRHVESGLFHLLRLLYCSHRLEEQ
jgi:hypothetical protein